jgi:hypothetical protein
MLEYAAVAGGGIQEWWAGQLLPFLDTIRASSYFWPGVAATSLVVLLAMRKVLE